MSVAGRAATAAGGEAILVIKHGALGDFIQATSAFAAIRRQHPQARIVLLTTAPFAALAAASPWFDDVWTDRRPPPWRIGACLALGRRLRAGRFTRVYDLQTSRRSSSYFHLLRVLGGGRAPEWSGIARGCSHPHANPDRDAMHTLDRQAEQLRMAGIAAVPAPDVSWMEADVGRFGLDARIPWVLLVAGASPHRPDKRWPSSHFADLARRLAARGVLPVLIGAGSDRPALDAIAAAAPSARNLADATSLTDIAALARRAMAAVGNDTGPMHLIAAAGCPTVVLFSHASDPALCAPRGPSPDTVVVLRRPAVADIEVAEVLDSIDTATASRAEAPARARP